MKYSYLFKATRKGKLSNYRIRITHNEKIAKDDTAKLHELLMAHGYNERDWANFVLLYIDEVPY